MQVVAALSYLHGEMVLHRDLVSTYRQPCLQAAADCWGPGLLGDSEIQASYCVNACCPSEAQQPLSYIERQCGSGGFWARDEAQIQASACFLHAVQACCRAKAPWSALRVTRLTRLSHQKLPHEVSFPLQV